MTSLGLYNGVTDLNFNMPAMPSHNKGPPVEKYAVINLNL
jgi:hypothetical protein